MANLVGQDWSPDLQKKGPGFCRGHFVQALGSPPSLGDVSLAGGGTLTPHSFVANAAGFYFSADIGIPTSPGATTYNTGDVAANTFTTVPLPPAAALLGSALVLGFGLMRRSATGPAISALTS